MAARLLAAVLFLVPAVARADVPIREGGTGQPFSVTVAAGAAVPAFAATAKGGAAGGFAEITGAWWASETFQAVVSGGFRGPDAGSEILVGPRARSGFYPMSVSVALQVGTAIVPGVGSEPLLVPRLGADLRIGPHTLLGMGYAVDLRLDTFAVVHRVYLDIGWRF